MRHGIADDESADDFTRPLSPNGRKKTARAAAGLVALVPRVDTIACSPKLRARQTAQLARDAWDKAAPPLTEWPELLEVFDFAPLHHKLRALENNDVPNNATATVLLIGHEPNLSLLASWLLADDVAAFGWEWKKAGVLALEIEFKGGENKVHWFLPPKTLRALGQ